MNTLITEKLDVKKTILLSFGFFASTLLWSVYNAYVPVILAERFLLSTAVIGIVMSIDNFFGVIFQPLFGRISDRTKTRFGRRLPFIFICLPICAALFTFVPHMNNLWSLMGLVIIFTFVMSIWRTPTVSLMPDLTPGPFRSQANGIVNLMGGIAAILAFAGGGLLFELGGFPLPFLVAAIVALGALAVLAVFVREPKIPEQIEKEKKVKLNLKPKEKRSLIMLLSAIFFWFMGYNAVETFFSLYAINTMGVSPGQASIMLSMFALAVVFFAIPAGFIGAKFGRRRTILVGLVGITVIFLPMVFITNINLARVLLVLSGMSWACVNINSLPMIVRIAGPMKIGTFIGYYYFFSFTGQIITTPIFGAIRDAVVHYESLFIYASATFVLAFICLMFVRHGEENIAVSSDEGTPTEDTPTDDAPVDETQN